MKANVKTTAKRKPKRDVFAELTEGLTALAEGLQGSEPFGLTRWNSNRRPQ